jgi:hypothetical protein
MICRVWIEVVLKSHRMSDSPPKTDCRPLQNAHPPECFADCAFSLVPPLLSATIKGQRRIGLRLLNSIIFIKIDVKSRYLAGISNMIRGFETTSELPIV